MKLIHVVSSKAGRLNNKENDPKTLFELGFVNNDIIDLYA